MHKGMEGIIYLLSNPAMPGIIKIGKTTKEDVKVRMKELYASGVPLPFECVYAARVTNIDEVEKALHTAFSPDRLNPKREFFEIEAGQAIAIIRLIESQNVTPLVDREINVIDPVELEAGKAYAKKRPRMNFVEMGIPLGAELVFNNNAEVALVTSDRTVKFRNEETSITAATRAALGEGYAYNIAPGPYWSYNGRRLRDIYNETYTN
jgi:hypothetical protein